MSKKAGLRHLALFFGKRPGVFLALCSVFWVGLVYGKSAYFALRSTFRQQFQI